MNHFRGWEQRYQGAAPPATAVYRSVLADMAGVLPAYMVGIACYLGLQDLDAATTPADMQSLLTECNDRLAAIHAEWGVKPLDESTQAEWASVTELKKELTARIAEYEARKRAVEEITAGAGKPAQVDAPFRPAGNPAHAGRTVNAHRARRVPDDIFALAEYRNLSSTPEELLQAYRDGAMFAVEQATFPHPMSVPAREQAHLQGLLDFADAPSPHNPNRELAQRILATGTPAYLRMFTKYIQGRPLTDADLRAAAPLTVQTDATGGYAVPFFFDPTLLHVGAWTITNPFRRACTVKTIVGTDTYNGATIAAFTVARAGEAVPATEGAGAVGQISAIVGKVHGQGTISMELLQDRPDITSELASLIAEAKDSEEENVFAVGVGAALGAGFTPIGVLAAGATTGAYTKLDTGTSVTLAAADADLVEAALPIRHRPNAGWFMSRAAIRQWQALETSTGKLFGGQYYANTGNPAVDAGGNTGLRLIGYPIWEVPSGLNGLAAQTVVSALINPASFYIIERAGMSVEVVPHVFDATTGYVTGQRAIYAWWRNTAKPSDINAGRRLTIKT